MNKTIFEISEKEYILDKNPMMKFLQSDRKTKEFIDVNVIVGLHQFEAHKIVLSSWSSVLKERILAQSSSEVTVLNIQTNDDSINTSIFEEIINFFYTSSITLSSSNVYFIYITAQKLDIPPLISFCEEFVREQLRPTNAVQWFSVSEELKISKLGLEVIEILKYYLKKIALREPTYSTKARSDLKLWNLEEILPEKKVKSLNFEEIQALLNELYQKQNIFEINDMLFDSAINWANNVPDRQKQLHLLLRDLSIENLSYRFRNKFFSQSKIFHPVSKFLIDTLRPKVEYNGLYCIDGFSSAISYLPSIESSWHTICPKVCSKAYFSSALSGRQIFLAGGIDDMNNVPQNSFEVFNCLTHRCTSLARMPNARWHSAAVAYNGYVYVAGGLDANSKTLSSMIRYNIATNEWISCAAMMVPRWGHKLVELGSRLFAIGGARNFFEKYNPINNESNNFETTSKHSPTIWELFKQRVGVSKSNNNIYGDWAESIVRNIEMYSPETDSWKSVGKTNYPCLLFGATSCSGGIYICSYEGFERFTPKFYDNHQGTGKKLPAPKISCGRSLANFGGHLKFIAIGGGENFEKADSTVMMYDISEKNQKPLTKLPNMNIAVKLPNLFVVNF